MPYEQTFTVGVGANFIYPIPQLPGWQPYNNFSWIWPPLDGERIAALEARLAKLERENRRLKKGLSRLYIERKQRQQVLEGE